jgi:thioesterase domain-containing protein
MLLSQGATGPPPSLAAIQPRGTRPPLFLCEAVGLYYPLIRFLGDDQPIYALYRALDREFPQLEDQARHYVDQIRTVQPRGPYFLGGASFGGLVALEVAQQLWAAGEDVPLLALFDTPGPGAYTLKRPVSQLLGHLANVHRFSWAYVREMGARLGRRVRLRLKLGNRRASSESKIVQGGELRALYKVVADRYQVRPYPGRITLFALEHRDAMSDSLFDPARGTVDPLLGWGRVAKGGVDLHGLPGGHITIFQEPHVNCLGVALRRVLDDAQMFRPEDAGQH